MALELKYNPTDGTLDLHGALPSFAKRKVLQLFTYDPNSRSYKTAPSVAALRLADGISAKINEEDMIAALEACSGRGKSPQVAPKTSQENESPAIECGLLPVLPGQFVMSSANSHGVGKVVRIEDDRARLAYFDCPTHLNGNEMLVPLHSLKRIELPRQSRVYVFDQDLNGWIAGRVVGPLGPDGYVTMFPHHDSREVREQDLFVRWNVPIQDPTENLAARLSEPYLYDRRKDFVDALTRQRAACGGMTGLLSSGIELEEHQIQVVRKILQDPIQRYLLADEVGLGKTIEAAVVLRQHVLDSPDSHLAVVLVPQKLMEQWKQEFIQKFFLGAYIAAGTVRVLAYDLVDVVLPTGTTMLVIDEAHRFGAFAFNSEKSQFYKAICQSTERLEKLLLLSATPVQHNEGAYLAMLHLLDPETYGAPDACIDQFRTQIRNRQTIADAYDTIRSEMPGAFILTAVDSILTSYPDDARLGDLRRQIQKHCEWDVPADHPDRVRLVAEIRTHVGECYKLHRRMIRTRRGEGTRGLLPGRCGVKIAPYRSVAEETVFRLLDEWRIESSLQDAGDSFVQAVRSVYTSASEGPASISALSSLSLWPPDQRRRLLASCLDWQNCLSKLEATEELLRAILSKDEEIKLLVFAGTAAQRASILSHLSECLRWKATSDHREFVEDGPIRILVCDAESEEGLNLRVRKGAIIHYDVPLNVNRLEQRLGRMDRFGVGVPVQSYLLLEEQSDFLKGWVRLLNECFKVFDRSVASLQYTIEAEAQELWKVVAQEGAAAFDEMLGRLGGDKGIVEKELKAVARQDSLDAVELEHSDEASYSGRIAAEDAERSGEFCLASDSWLQSLGFRRFGEPGEVDGRVARYGYMSSGRGQETLIPLQGLHDLIGLLDRNAPSPPFSWKTPGTYALTFDRLCSTRRGVRLARLGDPFVDWLLLFSRQDERGTSAIFWRHIDGLAMERTYELRFCFDVVFEANLEIEATAITSPFFRALQRKADDLYSPNHQRVWVDAQGESVESSRERDLLGKPYCKVNDYNLNLSRWANAPLDFDTSEWPDICARARDGALRFAREGADYRSQMEASLGRAATRFAVTMAQLESRATRQQGARRDALRALVDAEQQANETIMSAIRSPKVSVAGASAVFLSSINPFAE